MNPDRWPKVKEIFEAALAQPSAQRAAFLAGMCDGDEVLRREVESLLSSYDHAGSFMQAPAVEAAAESLVGLARSPADGLSLTAGQTINHYEILSTIGKGGMGEVYLAHDTHLARKVALKLLPGEFTQDPRRIQRFQQEARAASALNHPNIITIYEIGKHNATYFIATEFIDGVTLRQKLAGGPLPINQALEFAYQIALALTVAHEAKIIHRDIKPENVMIRGDGVVKVLDFGLAKLALEGTASSDAEAATLARRTETEPGKVMGTVAYMSPEQARGLKVDGRTDIFSLGVVLYEMVAGRQPFVGATSMDVVSAILNHEPELLAQYAPDTPRELERIVSKALRKNTEERYQTVRDLLIDLRDLKRELEWQDGAGRSLPPSPADRTPSSQAAVATANSLSSAEYIVTEIKRHKLGVAVALTVIILAAAVGAVAIGSWLMRQPKQLGAPVLSQLTTDTGLTTDPALSPDGKLLAYASDRSGKGNLDIWVRQIGGGEPIRLTQDAADDHEPSFSPDGTMIAFRSEKDGGGIYVVSALGGTPRKIASEGQRPRFSPDGSQIAYWVGGIGGGAGFGNHFCRIFVVASKGGVPKQLRSDFVGAAYPEWAPDGKHLLFLGNRDEKLPADESIDWWVTPLDDVAATATDILKATRKVGLTGPFQVYPWALIAPVWEARSDSLIFAARSGDSRNLWRIGISPQTWKVTGPPQRLTYSPAIEEDPTVASMADGSLKIALASLSENTDIWSLPVDADAGKVTGEPRQLTRDSTADFHASLSPDGRKMVWVSARSGKQEIWTKNLETGEDAALTASGLDKYGPNFSPDSRRVSFSAYLENKWNTYLVPATGGAAELICEDCGQITAWSPDGKYLLGNTVDQRLYLVEAASRRRIDFLSLSGRSFFGGKFSPDGRWITFGGGGHVYIAPFQGETPAPESSWFSALAELSRWSPDGNFVYGDSDYDGFTCIWGQRLGPATKRPLGSPIPVFNSHAARLTIFSPSVGRDKMIFTQAERTGNIWMAEWKGDW